jgi:transcriptional regulator with XRE-family HTH domain
MVTTDGPGRDRGRVDAVGRRLRAEREARQLSRDAVAARAGIDAARVASAEDGTHEPTLAVLWRLCDALGLTLAALFDGLDGDDRS